MSGLLRWVMVCAIALAGVGCGEKGGAAGTSSPAVSGAPTASSASPEREYSDEANASKKGEELANVYRLGVALTNAWYGAPRDRSPGQ